MEFFFEVKEVSVVTFLTFQSIVIYSTAKSLKLLPSFQSLWRACVTYIR